VDSNGFAYVGGAFGFFFDLYNVAASLPALAGLPTARLSDPVRSAYVSQVDAETGNLLESQFLGGSSLTVSGVALSGSTLWIAGATNLPNFPLSPNALVSPNTGPSVFQGAYLGAADFSQPQPPAGTPQIGCIVDAADLDPVDPVAPFQLLTIFGSGLGPATPVIATTLGGVSVNFGSPPAPLLYVSSNQINLAAPLVSGDTNTVVNVTVNSLSSPMLQFSTTSADPTLFVVPGSYSATYRESAAVALNADGSLNSSTNPAQLGFVISAFVNGLSMDPYGPPNLYATGGWSVTSSAQINPFVLQVGLQVPSSTDNLACQSNVCTAAFEIYDLYSYLSVSQPGIPSGLSFGGEVCLAQ
jgi:uncharacterized protein (TIGR03437 family)